MTIDDYAEKLKTINKKYPWIEDGLFLAPQGSDELIKMRQDYFFENNTFC